jgi:hypothetical protein
MAQSTIRTLPSAQALREANRWLARAARARSIAMLLSEHDARIALAHAAECEQKAASLMRRPKPIAA